MDQPTSSIQLKQRTLTSFEDLSSHNHFAIANVITVSSVKIECLLNKLKSFVLIKHVKYFGNRYPNAGYGGMFKKWLSQKSPESYGSWANGSAMRVSPCAWVAESLEESQRLAELSAIITHDHAEGIKGALATSDAIYLARVSASKDEKTSEQEIPIVEFCNVSLQYKNAGFSY